MMVYTETDQAAATDFTELGQDTDGRVHQRFYGSVLPLAKRISLVVLCWTQRPGKAPLAQ
jgi:hypothetical protein